MDKKKKIVTSALVLGLMVGGVLASHSNNALANSTSESADLSSTFNKWNKQEGSAEWIAKDGVSGKDITDQMKSNGTDSKAFFMGSRDGWKTYGLHDHLTKDEADKASQEVAKDFLTEKGLLKYNNARIVPYQKLAKVKGYTLITTYSIKKDDGNVAMVLVYVPDAQAREYQTYDGLKKLDPALCQFVGKGADDKNYQDFRNKVEPAFATRFMNLFDDSALKQFEGSSSSESSSISSSSSLKESSSSGSAESSSSSSSNLTSSSSSESEDSSSFSVKKDETVPTPDPKTPSENADQQINDSTPMKQASGSDTQTSGVGSNSDSSQPVESGETTNNGGGVGTNNGGNNAGTPAANGDASDLNNGNETDAQVNSNPNNQTLPQTSGDWLSELLSWLKFW